MHLGEWFPETLDTMFLTAIFIKGEIKEYVWFWRPDPTYFFSPDPNFLFEYEKMVRFFTQYARTFLKTFLMFM